VGSARGSYVRSKTRVGEGVATLDQHHCAVLAPLGGNGILGARFATGLFHQSNLHIPHDQYLNEWTAALAARIQTHPRAVKRKE